MKAPAPLLIVAHRWLGELAQRRWRCVRRAAVLRPVGVFDPICSGCGIQIAYDDVPHVERFVGEHMGSIAALEALATQLDITAAGLELQKREAWFRRGVA